MRSFLGRLSVLVVLAASVTARGDDRIQDALKPFVDRGTLAGAVALASSADRTVSVDAVGYSDVAAGRR